VNKPELSYYNKDAETTSLCGYQCKYWESSDTNPDCLDPLSEEFERIGGAIPFLVLMVIFVIVCLLLFATLSYRS